MAEMIVSYNFNTDKGPVGAQPPLRLVEPEITKVREGEAIRDPFAFVDAFRESSFYQGRMSAFMSRRNTDGLSEQEIRGHYEELDGGGGQDIARYGDLLLQSGVKFQFDLSNFSSHIRSGFDEYKALSYTLAPGSLWSMRLDPSERQEEMLKRDAKRRQLHIHIAEQIAKDYSDQISSVRFARGLVAVINADSDPRLLKDAEKTDSSRLREYMGAVA